MMSSSDTETVKLDSGHAYRIRLGHDEVIATMLVCAHCDAIHVDLDLLSDGGQGAERVRLEASLALDPWSLQLTGGDALPAHVDLDTLSAGLRTYGDTLAHRADRLFQSRDRDHWRKQDLSFFEPGFKVPYKRIFPGDFDLIDEIDGHRVWFDDYHCMTAGCPCTTAKIWVHLLGKTVETTEVGETEIDLAGRSSRPSGDPEAAQLLERWLADRRNRRALEYRRSEIRRIAPAVAKSLGLTTPAAPPPLPKVGRNDPCPCGSGKKYKRCCLGTATKRTAPEKKS